MPIFEIMDEIYFEDIKQKILESLESAQNYIWLAVAWITDNDYFLILEKKLEEGLDIKVIIMDDEFNRHNMEFNDFLIENDNIFYRDSHHKYCLIDDEIFITGSFNWTNKASLRTNGENILVSHSIDVISEAKKKFIASSLGQQLYIKSVTDFYIEKAKHYSYGESADSDTITWWFDLSDAWKVFFIIEVSEELATTDELDEYWKSLELEECEDNFFDNWEIEKVEAQALDEFLILISNITKIKNKLYVKHELISIEPLFFLKRLKRIEEIEFKSDEQFEKLSGHMGNLTFSSLSFNKSIPSTYLSDNIAKNLTYVHLSFTDIEERIVRFFSNNANKINLHFASFTEIDLDWLIGDKVIDNLCLTNADIINFGSIDKLMKCYKKVSLYNCQIISGVSREFRLENYDNLSINYECHFWEASIYKNLADINERFNKEGIAIKEKQISIRKRIVGDSEYKYFDRHGKRYKFIDYAFFVDSDGNPCSFGDWHLTDVNYNKINMDGSIDKNIF